MSFLAKELRRNAQLLEKGAKKHLENILDFEERVKESSESIKNLFIQKTNIDSSTLFPWIKKYLGTDAISFTAIDGTMFKTSVMEASIFFAGAYESSGVINCSDPVKGVEIEYIHNYTTKGRGITSVLPLQVTELVEIDTQFDLDILHSDSGVQIQEDVLLDQSNIAESVMLFSEYFLAYKTLIESKDRSAQVLLFDRSIAGDHSSLIARTQKQILWKKTVNLLGYSLKNTHSRPFDENDFYWGRWFTADYFDPIRPYLKFKILKVLLEKRKSFSQTELSEILHIPRTLKNDLATELKFLERKNFIYRKDKLFELNPVYYDSWINLKNLVWEIGNRIFYSEADELETKSPFLIVKQGIDKKQIEKWLTTRDLAFLTLFCQYMIIEWFWQHKGIAIGLSKDTAARDFRRQLLPIATNQNWIKPIAPEIISLPQSDRIFLQQFATTHPDFIPWILTEYDAVFRTIIQEEKLVIGAKSNLTGVMKLFAKSYLQLKNSPDAKLQSHVLLIDRIIHPNDLLQEKNIQTLQYHKSERSEFDYDLATFFPINNEENYLQQFILSFLITMMPESIPEAYGHNKPLYIADKVAKFYLNEFKRLLFSMGTALGNSSHKDQYSYEKFRETREEIEFTRHKSD